MRPKNFYLPVLTIMALFLLTQKVDAQFFVGGKIQGSNSTLQGDLPGNNFNRYYSGGLIVGYTFTEDDLLSVQSELQYSLKGTNQKFQEIPQLSDDANAEEVFREFDNDLDLSYIEVPIMAKLSLSLGSSTFPYGTGSGPFNIDLYAGPYVGYLMDAEASRHVITTRTIENIREDGETVQQTITTESNRGRFRIENQFEDGVSMPQIIESLKNAGEDDPIAQAFNYPEDVSNGLNSLDVGVTGGIGFSVEVGDNSTVTLDGRVSRGIFSVDDLYFNSIRVNNEGDGGPAVEQSKADLFNTTVSLNLGFIYEFSQSYSFN